ncbi:MAG: hypothetical protein HY071_01860 [Chloroflexi bacterium]|nr:hypothetical protein [Chloroflexota bacterium]
MLATIVVSLAAIAVAQATTPDRTLTFVDERSGLTLTIQTDPAAGDSGHFAFRVPSLGVYVGSVGATMRALTPTSVVVDYSGPATLRPITDGAGAVTGTVRTPTPATIRLQAQIDPSHHTAEGTLTDGSARFHLVAPAAGKGDLLQALKTFEAAMAADDTSAIYPLMNSDVRGASSVAQFSQSWREQESRLGRITSLQRVTLSDPQTDSSGLTSAIATYATTVTAPAGTVTSQTFDAHFVLQPDGWKLWYTTTR